MPFAFQAVLPGKFKGDVFRKEMVETMESLSAGILLDFGKTVNTWANMPDFDIKFDVNDRFIEGHVFVDAQKQGDTAANPFGGKTLPAPPNLIYYFLNFGTAIRYATMTRDFTPKTSVRVIGSFPGSGGLSYVSIFKPRPGIMGRHWDEEIAKKYRRVITNVLRFALQRGVRASGHEYL